MKLEITKLPYLDNSSTLLNKLQPKGGLVALESSLANHENGRWSIISAEPADTVVTFGKVNNQELTNELSCLFNKIPANDSDLPFTGGIIGHASYDLGITSNKAAVQSTHSSLPTLIAGLYTWAFLIDHLKNCTIFVYLTELSKTSKEDLILLFHKAKDLPQTATQFEIKEPFQPTWTKKKYQENIQSIHSYINAGDVYQVNLAQSFSSQYTGNPIYGYEKLKKFASVPFASFFNYKQFCFASASPELFISTDRGAVTTKPIKGTLPRKTSTQEDKLQANQLKNSKKDQAENLMIVDLLRNDISKNATNVKVPSLFNVETFETVHHLVSTVTASLPNTISPLKLFLDAFPGGSITGAPKKRAMEVINELEATPRGFYCGSAFYHSANDKFNSNILIRSFMFEEGKVTCWSGGGIISDSIWELELQESLDKISKLMECLNN